MPQFDKILFFNQIFWLVLSFFCFYVILIFRYLPSLSRVLKVRSKRLEKVREFSRSFKKDTFSTLNNVNFISRNVFRVFYS
jgi:hypothetical protein